MEQAIQRGIEKMEEMGYIKFNESFNKEMAWTFMIVEINKLTFREVNEFINKQPPMRL